MASTFSLEEIRQISVSALRAKFTQAPRALDVTNIDDALNPDNYTLTGPDSNYVISCSTVDGDSSSIDLHLAAALAIGVWHLAVENVVEALSGIPLPST